MDANNILSVFSNTDTFDWQRIVDLPNGCKGLAFHEEHQGNFTKCCVVDGTDDPPVLWSWYDDENWTPYAARFSDCIFAQVFDYQYQLGLHDGCEDTLSLRNGSVVTTLRARYEEAPETGFIIEGERWQENRFIAKDGDRLLLTSSDANQGDAEVSKVTLQLFGREMSRLIQLREEICEAVPDHIAPDIFFCPHTPRPILERLDHWLENGWLSRAKWAARQTSDEVSVRRLHEAHQIKPLAKRGENLVFDWSTQYTRDDAPNMDRIGSGNTTATIGGPDWGVEISVTRLQGEWFAIHSIRSC